MTVVPYNSGDKQIQEEEKKKIEARVEKAKEAYRAGYNRRRAAEEKRRRRRRRRRRAEERRRRAAAEDDDAETEIDDVEMAVVSLKY